jgi:hypothetical protein
MRCDRCGCHIDDESAVHDTRSIAVGSAGFLGQSTATQSIVLCRRCAGRRLNSFWLLLGLITAAIVGMVVFRLLYSWLG